MRDTIVLRLTELTIVLSLAALLIGCSVSSSVPLNAEQIAMREQKVKILVAQSVQLMRTGDDDSLDEAFNTLELARDLLPLDPRVIDGLGCVEWRRGNYRLAERFFKKALEYDPYYDRAYAHLAFVADHRGDKEASIELLRIAVKMNPLNYRSRNNYAVQLLERGNSYDATHQLQRASKSSSDEDAVLIQNLELVSQASKGK